MAEGMPVHEGWASNGTGIIQHKPKRVGTVARPARNRTSMKWTLKQLVKRMQMGYQSRKAVREDSEGTHWLIQMRDLREDGTLRRESLTRFVPERVPEPYIVREGDVLFQVRGWNHWAGVVRGLDACTLAANHFYILRLDTVRVLPEYLAWYINQSEAQRYFQKGAHGAGNVTVVPRAIFENLEIPAPSLAVQEHIAALDRLQWREAELIQQLQTKRTQWLRTVCLRAAKGRSGNKETDLS